MSFERATSGIRDQKRAIPFTAIVTKAPWPKAERRNYTLTQVKVTDQSEIEILGQTGHVLEYQPQVDPKARWSQTELGLHISAMRAQRLYNNSRWPNPVVFEITNAVKP